MKTNLQELSALTGGTIAAGDHELPITGFNSIQEAEPGDITFLGNSRYAPALAKSKASAVLVDEQFNELPEGMAVIRVDNPTLQFSRIIKRFGPQILPFTPGVHPSAVISPTAKFDPAKVFVGPCVTIDDEAEIGDGSSINAGTSIGRGAKLGTDCFLHARVVVNERCLLGNRVILHSGAVVGSDGFGYEFTAGRHQKIDQVGIVQIDDDVEIGACATIDRARFGRTWIGEGTKIDNLVQIAHNVVIGKHCLIVSQTGISGSTHLGNYVTLAGQVGVAGHLQIADQVLLLAKSGVTKSITQPGAYTGYPAKPLMEGRRALASPAKIPDIIQRLKAMEQRVVELEAKLSAS
ncbi:MAG: UDP-3-O-(3-hydroxymyristoyl)glucosamine N-acyltransferase [Verrucomicrobiota bacterium]|jgi:UDP-3-O-[3-hydroxymyristoyl] glucosamine N-acyltransferase